MRSKDELLRMWDKAQRKLQGEDSLQKVLNWIGDDGAREAFEYISRMHDLGIEVPSRARRGELKEEFLRIFRPQDLADEIVKGLGTSTIRRMLEDKMFEGLISKEANWVESEEYHLRSRDWDKFEGELEAGSDEGEGKTNTPEILEKRAYGYFKQDDFDDWHNDEVDLDQYNVDEEVDEGDETGHWWDQPEEMPHVIEEGDQAEDNIPVASADVDKEAISREFERTAKDFEQAAVELGYITEDRMIELEDGSTMKVPTVDGKPRESDLIEAEMRDGEVKAKAGRGGYFLYPSPK